MISRGGLVLAGALVMALAACRDQAPAPNPVPSPAPSAVASVVDAAPLAVPEPLLPPLRGPVASRVSEALVAFGRDEDGPLVEEALPSQRFCFDAREVFLVDHPKNAGYIDYAYVLVAFEPNQRKPAITVASEKKTTTLGSGSHFLIATERKKGDAGVGRNNLGAKDDWARKGLFLAAAFEELGRAFDVAATPQDVTAQPEVNCAKQPRSKKHYVAPDAGPPPEETPIVAPGATKVVERDPKKVEVSQLALDASSIYWRETDATATGSWFHRPATLWAAPRVGGEPRVLTRGQAGARGLRSNGRQLFWARDGAIARVDVAGGAPSEVFTNKDVDGFVIWTLADDDLFVALPSDKKTVLHRASVKGGGSSVVATIDQRIVEMAADRETLWMAAAVPPDTAHTLLAVLRSGGPVTTKYVAKDHAVSHLVAKDGAIYWTAGSRARIYRLAKDDAQPRIIAGGEEPKNADEVLGGGLVEVMRGTATSLYLLSWGPNGIRKVPLQGGPIQVVQTWSTGSMGHELAVDDSSLYLLTLGSILRLPQ